MPLPGSLLTRPQRLPLPRLLLIRLQRKRLIGKQRKPLTRWLLLPRLQRLLLIRPQRMPLTSSLLTRPQRLPLPRLLLIRLQRKRLIGLQGLSLPRRLLLRSSLPSSLLTSSLLTSSLLIRLPRSLLTRLPRLPRLLPRDPPAPIKVENSRVALITTRRPTGVITSKLRAGIVMTRERIVKRRVVFARHHRHRAHPPATIKVEHSQVATITSVKTLQDRATFAESTAMARIDVDGRVPTRKQIVPSRVVIATSKDFVYFILPECC